MPILTSKRQRKAALFFSLAQEKDGNSIYCLCKGKNGRYISGNIGRRFNREECNGSRGHLWNGRWYQRQTTY